MRRWIRPFYKLTIQKRLIVGQGFLVMIARGLVTTAQLLVAVVPFPVLLMENLIADMYERCYRLGRKGFY